MDAVNPWTPKVGMVLKHKTIHQTVRITDRLELPGMVFWEVDDTHRSAIREKAWMIHEPWLVEQYEPKEGGS